MDTYSLSASQSVFCLFYAIFWGLVANAQIRWKAFDWPLAIVGRKEDSEYKPSWERLKQSIWLLTVVPVVLFIVLVSILTLAHPRTFGVRLVIQLISAVFAAHAAFAPYRLWLSKMEGDAPKYFYQVSNPDGAIQEGVYASQPSGEEKITHDLNSRWSRYNKRVAYGYVIVSLVFTVVAVTFG